MDAVLGFAEQLIEKSSKPEILREYYKEKNHILFGSLADLITEYQLDNQRLTRELELLRASHSNSLEESLRREFIQMLSPICQMPDAAMTLDEYCNMALSAIENHEKQCRIDIERFRSNRKKISNKIKEMKHPDREPRSFGIGIEQLKQRLTEVEAIIAEYRKQVVELEQQNAKAKSELVQFDSLLEEKKDKLSKTLNSKRISLRNNKEINDSRACVIDSLRDVSHKLHGRKMGQRFGNFANSKDIGTIIELRSSISELEGENEVLKESKKKSIIDRIKIQQREVLRNFVAIHA
jgi:hypothetical protein